MLKYWGVVVAQVFNKSMPITEPDTPLSHSQKPIIHSCTEPH